MVMSLPGQTFDLYQGEIMSKDSCQRFLWTILESETLRQRWKSVTSLQEIMLMGRRYGYEFGQQDIIDASSALGEKAEGILRWDFGRKPAANGAAASHFYHHEFNIADIPGFEPVVVELDAMKIQPTTVSMDRFRAAFRQEDFDFAAVSPDAPDFQCRFQQIWGSPPVSLGTAAEKTTSLTSITTSITPNTTRTSMRNAGSSTRLEVFFGFEIRFSASLWYPPKAYRTWHTNDNQPGWRMYIVDFDEDPKRSGGQSFFRYMNPHSKEIVTLYENPRMVRLIQDRAREGQAVLALHRQRLNCESLEFRLLRPRRLDAQTAGGLTRRPLRTTMRRPCGAEFAAPLESVRRMMKMTER